MTAKLFTVWCLIVAVSANVCKQVYTSNLSNTQHANHRAKLYVCPQRGPYLLVRAKDGILNIYAICITVKIWVLLSYNKLFTMTSFMPSLGFLLCVFIGVFQKNTAHLCFNITMKGQMIVPDCYNRNLW